MKPKAPVRKAKDRQRGSKKRGRPGKRGMEERENHRDLLTRLSTTLAMTEAAYLEVRRRRDL